MTMNFQSSGKSFIFNEEIDIQCINDLYGDDYPYIEEVFVTVLSEYKLLAENVVSSFHSQNIPALKSAVHKIKPIFGFVGLTATQRICQDFEDQCQGALSFDELAHAYGELTDYLIRSRALIEEEQRKLELFNRQRA
jgi:HPt (histidine-containing phosphotransfer) domain-containing protein